MTRGTWNLSFRNGLFRFLPKSDGIHGGSNCTVTVWIIWDFPAPRMIKVCGNKSEGGEILSYIQYNKTAEL